MAAAWALVVLVSGLLPTRGAAQALAAGHDDLLTAGAHFCAYAVLGFLLAVAGGDWDVTRRVFLGAAVLALGLGIAIEMLQGLLPYRDGQLVDVFVDAAGVAVGLGAFSAAAWARGRAPTRQSRRE